jgi:hypothetical protein
MASIVSAGTTSSTALNMSADTSGVLQLASNNGTTAVTVDTSQQVGINRTPSAGGGPLQVGFDSSANAGVRIQTTNASTAGEILNFINSSNTSSGKVIYGTSQTSVVYQTTTAGQSTGATLILNGVAFPATQVASSDANTLDDYEEGTWNPRVGGTATYNGGTAGFYTKVGRLVTVRFYIGITLIGTGSKNIISGIPFTANSATAGTIPLYGSLGVSLTTLGCYAESDGNIYLTGNTAATSSTTYNGSGNILGDAASIYGSITYQV